MPSARFAEKCSRNEKTKKHVQNHKGKTYNGNKFQRKFMETNTRSARLAKSAIPTKQKHLNKKHQ